MNTWGKCSEIAEYDIMANRTIQVDLHMPTQSDIRGKDVSGTDHNTFSDGEPLRTLNVRMDNRFEIEASFSCSLNNLFPDLRRPDRTGNSGMRK